MLWEEQHLKTNRSWSQTIFYNNQVLHIQHYVFLWCSELSSSLCCGWKASVIPICPHAPPKQYGRHLLKNCAKFTRHVLAWHGVSGYQTVTRGTQMLGYTAIQCESKPRPTNNFQYPALFFSGCYFRISPLPFIEDMRDLTYPTFLPCCFFLSYLPGCYLDRNHKWKPKILIWDSSMPGQISAGERNMKQQWKLPQTYISATMSPIPVNPRNSVTFGQSLLNPVDHSRENRLHALVSFLTYSDSLTGMLELEFMLPDITHGYGRDDVGPVDLVFMALIPSSLYSPHLYNVIQCYQRILLHVQNQLTKVPISFMKQFLQNSLFLQYKTYFVLKSETSLIPWLAWRWSFKREVNQYPWRNAE